MKRFLDTFKGVNIPKRYESELDNVMIERMVLNKELQTMHAYSLSEHLIVYDVIEAVEKCIEEQLFAPKGLKFRLIDRYELSGQYTLPNFFKQYKNSIAQILKQQSVIDQMIFLTADMECKEDSLVLSCENDELFRQRREPVSKLIRNIFKQKADMDVQVVMKFDKEISSTQEKSLYQEPVKRTFTEKIQQTEKEDSPAEKDNTPVKEQKSGAKEEHNKGGNSGYKNYRKPVPDDPEVVYGKNCEGDLVSIAELVGDMGEVVIEGQVLSTEERETKNGKIIFTFIVTDFTDSISVKIWLQPEDMDTIKNVVAKSKFVMVKGMPLYDTYAKDITISSVRGIKPGKDHRVMRQDNSEKKRVELHAHTLMSDMDAVVDVKNLIKRAKAWGHKAIAVTDHGVVQAFPEANHAITMEEEFKVIYGVEAYLVDDLIEMVKNPKGQSLRDSFVVFDIETTGFGPVNDKIIEIGAVKVVDGKMTETFSKFINPEIPIPYRIEQLTGINDNMVMDAPTIEVILPEFLAFCQGCALVAHNADFDTGFIREKAAQMGLTTDFTVLDTVNLARALQPELNNFKLDTVAKACNVLLENHHRAVDDAMATAGIFVKYIKDLESRGITDVDGLNNFGTPTVEVIRKLPSYHAIILVKNEVGRINLYRLVSESHLTYYNRRPKLPKSLFMQYREGLIIGSACEAGELYQAILRNKSDEEITKLVNFYDYLEIQPLGNNMFMIESDKCDVQDEEDLKNINRKIVALGEEYNKLVVATCDVHFLDPEDEIYRRIIMAGKGFKDADNQAPLYLRTTEEMMEEFMYLGREKAEEIVITNTNKIADMIEKISPVSPDKCPPVIENSDKDLREICYRRAHEIYGENLPEIVEERLERELKSIIGNGYAVMYIIAQKLVWKSNEDGYLVGSRGSVGSSFAATMAGISEVNPLPAHYYCKKCHYYDFDSEEVRSYSGSSGCDMPDKNCPKCGEPLCKDGHDIPFETFLGFKGNKEPDIDLNFSGEYQSNAHDYTEIIFGAGQTFRAGTIGTLAEKTAYGYVMHYCEDHGIKKRSAEMERIASGCVGVRRTTGQHPGGIVVLPIGHEIYQFTPVQHPANDMNTKIITTHFDYHSIDQNLLKLDILGHDDPTMIRMLEDLTGVDAKTIRLDDEKVLSLFADTSALGITPEDIDGCQLGSLGVPEFGTEFVMQMLIDTHPKTFSDLVRISGLSHGTDVWLNNAQYFIANGDCTLSTAICCRDDIMVYLIHMGMESERSFKIMESVRKGKGLTPDMEEDMRANGIPEWYMESCRRIKYMFPKAHAAAYVMMGFRIAYYKVYYPLAYYAAYFSIRASAFNYELMCLGRERLEFHMREIKKKLNDPAQKPSPKDKDVLKDMRIVQEMYARGFSFVPIDIYKAKANRFQIVNDKQLMPSFVSIDGMGDKAAEMLEDEAAKGKFISRDDMKARAKISGTLVDLMGDLGLLGDMPHSNQMSFLDLGFM